MNPTLPDPVQWTEGMLLSPQHLQQERIYWHAQLGYRVDAALADGWGVRVLEPDAGNLLNGCVSIARLECVLPDGSVIQHPGSGRTEPLALSLDKYGGDRTRALRVYVVARTGDDNAAVPGHPDRRYDAGTPQLAADENTGKEPVSVDRLRLRYELLAYDADATPPANLSACALMLVQRNSQGAYELAPYHPPMLRMDACDFQGAQSLRSRLDTLVQQMWLKIDELTAGIDEKTGLDDLMSGAGTSQRDHARTLAAALPLLEISVSDPAIHPRQLYRELALAVGMLASLGARPQPLRMRPYVHTDCLAQFSEACQHLEEKLQQLHSDYERHRFSPFKEGFSRRLFDDMHGDVIVELRPQPGQSAADVGAWLRSANIASADLIGVVQEQRQRGATVRAITEKEARQRRLPTDAALFFIQNERIHSEHKNAFEPGEPLMVQGVNRQTMPAHMFLYRYKQRRIAAHEAGHA